MLHFFFSAGSGCRVQTTRALLKKAVVLEGRIWLLRELYYVLQQEMHELGVYGIVTSLVFFKNLVVV